MKNEFNGYGDLLPKWQVDLIVARAKRMHVRREDIEDALQEIVPEVLKFRFDPQHANGATEETALTALIDNRLCKIKRDADRYYRCKDRATQSPYREETVESHEGAVDLSLDLQTVLQALPAPERRVCDGLARGESFRAIAEAMGVTQAEVKRLIRVCRAKLTEAGLAPKGVAGDEE